MKKPIAVAGAIALMWVFICAGCGNVETAGSDTADKGIYSADEGSTAETDEIGDADETEEAQAQQEDTEGSKSVTLKKANANAKIFFNELAVYLADEYTKGRTYPTVLAEGDLAETTSPEGLLLDGEHSGAGDSFLTEAISVYNLDMRKSRVYAGFDVEEDSDEFDFFVQWMSEDGVIGQYPTPIREEYRDEVQFGTFCER